MAKRTRRTADERFREKVYLDATTDCWEWAGGRTRDGYGVFWSGLYRWSEDGQRLGPIMLLAHRWAYERFNGAIPDGLYICHTCDNPPCVNPAHLIAATQADNVHDCEAKGRRNQTRYVKLSAEVHEEIRHRYSGVRGEQAALAREYGTTQTAIGRIVGGRSRGRCVGGAGTDEYVHPRYGSARLDEGRVAEIRRRWAAGESRSALAVAFDVSYDTVSSVVHRRSWKHVP